MQLLSRRLSLGADRPRTLAALQMRPAQGMQDRGRPAHASQASLGRPPDAASCPAIACHGTFGVALAMAVAARLTRGSHPNSSSTSVGQQEAGSPARAKVGVGPVRCAFGRMVGRPP
jgi:hypothetical protein